MAKKTILAKASMPGMATKIAEWKSKQQRGYWLKRADFFGLIF